MSDFEKSIPSKRHLANLSSLRDEAFAAITDIAAERRKIEENASPIPQEEKDALEDELKLNEMLTREFMANSAILTERLQEYIMIREAHPTLADIADELAELGTLMDYVKKNRLFGSVIAKIIDLEYLDAQNDFDFESKKKPGSTWLSRAASQFAVAALMLQRTIDSYKLQREELLLIAEQEALLEDILK